MRKNALKARGKKGQAVPSNYYKSPFPTANEFEAAMNLTRLYWDNAGEMYEIQEQAYSHVMGWS